MHTHVFSWTYMQNVANIHIQKHYVSLLFSGMWCLLIWYIITDKILLPLNFPSRLPWIFSINKASVTDSKHCGLYQVRESKLLTRIDLTTNQLNGGTHHFVINQVIVRLNFWMAEGVTDSTISISIWSQPEWLIGSPIHLQIDLTLQNCALCSTITAIWLVLVRNWMRFESPAILHY
jgi:hypothetical protein